MTFDVLGTLIDFEAGILDSVQVRAGAAEMVGWNKPDPQIFAFTRGRLSKEGSGFADIIHVAQSQYHDIAVARRLGYHTC